MLHGKVKRVKFQSAPVSPYCGYKRLLRFHQNRVSYAEGVRYCGTENAFG